MRICRCRNYTKKQLTTCACACYNTVSMGKGVHLPRGFLPRQMNACDVFKYAAPPAAGIRERNDNYMKIEGQVRIPSGCAISAVISRDGKKMTGEGIMKSMIPMHDRSNGLGGGFAAYGIYPEYKDFYAFHIFYTDSAVREECEKLLRERL